MDLDIHCVLANQDGIVPRETAASVAGIVGSDRVWVREVGTSERWYAHADLFIGPRAEDEVFAPMAEWMTARRRARRSRAGPGPAVGGALCAAGYHGVPSGVPRRYPGGIPGYPGVPQGTPGYPGGTSGVSRG